MKRGRVLRGEADPLEELEQLCGHRWDGHVLLQLTTTTEPLRRADLAAAVTRAARRRISDGQLDRTIRRLGERKLVRFSVDTQGHKRYQLTAPGHHHAERLGNLIQLLRDPLPTAASRALWQPEADQVGTLNRKVFARDWSNLLQGAGPVPLNPVERYRVLSTLAGRLQRALAADPFDPAAGRHVGATLVEMGFAAPDALGCTITMVTGLVCVLPDPAEASIRVTCLVASLAVGFAEASRTRTLDAQDTLRAAAMRAAFARAEQPRPGAGTVKPGPVPTSS